MLFSPTQSHDLILIFKIIFSHRSGDTKIKIFPQTQVETLQWLHLTLETRSNRSLHWPLKKSKDAPAVSAGGRTDANSDLRLTAAADTAIAKHLVKSRLKKKSYVSSGDFPIFPELFLAADPQISSSSWSKTATKFTRYFLAMTSSVSFHTQTAKF